MTDSVITVENLGKRYRIRHQAQRQRYHTLRDVLAEKSRSVVRRPIFAFRFLLSALALKSRSPVVRGPSSEDFWALKDVSFEVHQGDVLGIIGCNGAGKSTLLKILSRITEPTEGRARIKGRVASLLEVGTGFHPELTGRENIFLNGAILGMTRAEIRKKFDEIVAFAEVDKFLDTPVKRYSSGMYVRLAFAVAAHLEPEILIVDEVLAVGDAQFQKKCLGTMEDVARTGRTVLFVSHNMSAVKQLCGRCLWLREGKVGRQEEALRVVNEYLSEETASHKHIVRFDPVSTEDPVQLLAARVWAPNGDGEGFHNGLSLTFEALIDLRRVVDLAFCMPVFREGELAFFANSYHKANELHLTRCGLFTLRFVIPPYLLNPGPHTVGLYIADSRGARSHYVRHQKLLSFQLTDDEKRRGGLYSGHWPGSVCPLLEIGVDYLAENPEWASPAKRHLSCV
jgi:lipopolysaccharide transport system ATP-binding protein